MSYELTNEDLMGYLREQINFLKSSCQSYDNGFESEAKRIAVIIRVLLHDSERSKSLLTLLRKKNIKFYDFSWDDNQSISPFAGMLMIRMTTKEREFVPFLEMGRPELYTRPKLDFETWWHKIVVKDYKNNQFSRKSLVLAVSNKDGGAHVDAKLNNEYAALTKEHSLGFGFISDNGEFHEVSTKPELACIRQIAFELLKTLKDEFPSEF